MAFAAPYLTEDEKKKQEQGGAVSTTRPTSGVVESAAPSGAAPTAAPAAPTPGTGFVNLQQYLDVNKGAGGTLASAATKGLTQQVADYGSEAAKVAQTGASKIQDAAGTKTAEQLRIGLGQDASANKDAAQAFLGAGYAGPAAGDFTTDLAAKKDALTDSLGKVDSAENLQTALADTYGKAGNYSKGFGLLDQFLVQGDQSGRDTLASVKNKAADVTKKYDTTAQQLTSAEDAARKQLAANQAAVKSTARFVKDDTLKKADSAIAAMNKNLDTSREGASAAGYRDVIDENKRADLEALDAILTESGDYSGGGFNAGTPKPTDKDLEGYTPVPVGRPGAKDMDGDGTPDDQDSDADGDGVPDPRVPDANDPTLPRPVNPNEPLVPEGASGSSSGPDRSVIQQVLGGGAAADALKDFAGGVRQGHDKINTITDQAKNAAVTAAGNSDLGKYLNAALNNPLTQGAERGNKIGQDIAAKSTDLAAKGAAEGAKLGDKAGDALAKIPTPAPKLKAPPVVSGNGIKMTVPQGIAPATLQKALDIGVDVKSLPKNFTQESLTQAINQRNEALTAARKAGLDLAKLPKNFTVGDVKTAVAAKAPAVKVTPPKVPALKATNVPPPQFSPDVLDQLNPDKARAAIGQALSDQAAKAAAIGGKVSEAAGDAARYGKEKGGSVAKTVKKWAGRK